MFNDENVPSRVICPKPDLNFFWQLEVKGQGRGLTRLLGLGGSGIWDWEWCSNGCVTIVTISWIVCKHHDEKLRPSSNHVNTVTNHYKGATLPVFSKHYKHNFNDISNLHTIHTLITLAWNGICESDLTKLSMILYRIRVCTPPRALTSVILLQPYK